MVKKRLKDGSECRKCAQVTQLLQQRGDWDRINEIVWAEETDAHSPGMQLARQYGVETAPFFVVEQAEGNATVSTSALQFTQDCFRHTPSLFERAEEASRSHPDDLGLP